MGGQFTRTRDFPLMSEHREIGKSDDGIAEQAIYSQRSVWVARFEVISDSRAVLLGFWRPHNSHARSVIRARRAAKPASTSSLPRPCPA